MHIVATLIFLLFAVVHSNAETAPSPLANDSRVKVLRYNANEVYVVNTHLHYVTTIQLAAGEDINTILIGDSASWEITRLNTGNTISLKPTLADISTNLTVFSTAPDGSDRRYFFNLVTENAPSSSQKLTYNIEFHYPINTVTTYKASLTSPSAKRNRNHRYFTAGDAPFKPLSVWDDGEKTYFQFPPDAPTPAIFRVYPDGNRSRDAIVNVVHDGDVAIVPNISQEWTLRISDQVVCVARRKRQFMFGF